MPLNTEPSQVLDIYSDVADRGRVVPTFCAENMTTTEGSVLIVPAPAVLQTIYYYDVTFASGLTPAQQYDVCHTTVCVQGLVNRADPRFFIKYWPYGDGGGDRHWLKCQGWPVHRILNATELFNTLRAYVTGVVVYDSDPGTGVDILGLQR